MIMIAELFLTFYCYSTWFSFKTVVWFNAELLKSLSLNQSDVVA